MPKKTTALIVILGVITVGLLYLALVQSSQPPSSSLQATRIITPTPVPYHTMLSLSSQSPTLLNVYIDTVGDTDTAVQLELAYDPQVLTNVKVIKGTFFDQSVELFNQVDVKNGRISYAIAIPPNGQPKNGQGVVAMISYNRLPGATQTTGISFLPKTKVTAQGISYSVLKTTKDFTIPPSQ